MTPEVRFLLDLESRNQRTKEAAGACLFGTDSSKWPAWWFDAVTLLASERMREACARIEAQPDGR